MLACGIPPDFRSGVHYSFITAIRHRVSPEFIRLGGWVRTATAGGIQQADCHQISHLSAHILYLVAVRNQYAECEKQHNNYVTAVHRPRQHTRRATKIYCIQYFSARSIFNCSIGGYLAVMSLLGWRGVIFLCSVSHPEKSGNFLLVWAVMSGAKQFYGHRSEIMWTITAGTQKC